MITNKTILQNKTSFLINLHKKVGEAINKKIGILILIMNIMLKKKSKSIKVRF